MNIEKERESFEAWQKEIAAFSDQRSAGGDLYFYPEVNYMWAAWQAAKADQMTGARAMGILLPQSRSTLDGSVRLNNIEGFIDGSNLFQPTCIDGYGNYTAEQLKAVVWWLENKATS